MKTILVDAAHTFTIKTPEGFKIFESMRKLLDKFPNRKIILTNANDEQFETYGLNNVPYEVFTLKHNPDKEDPEYYKKMLAHFNLKTEDVIYFEHAPKAVESARSIGIKTYLWGGEEASLSDLNNFLELSI